MRIASWNVNSVRARSAVLSAWLENAQPDVLLLQEIKCETTDFPTHFFENFGYQALVAGQKSYNGVALLSRIGLEPCQTALPGDSTDDQARYVEAQIGPYRVASLYLPNGNPAPGDKYTYKLDWMRRLQKHMTALLASETPIILGGDFNVIPRAIDVYDPASWQNDALFRPETRAAWRRLIAMGYTDAFRALHPHQKKAYSFWDYQAGAWQRDLGLRIDHFLLSPEAIDQVADCFIDLTPRGWEKASDHTPVILDLKQGKPQAARGRPLT